MKLLNEAERGHLCSHPGDHACRWHGQRTSHLGANYTDFTPARVWIKPFGSDGWVRRDITPKLSHLWPLEAGNDWQQSKGDTWKKAKEEKAVDCFLHLASRILQSYHTRNCIFVLLGFEFYHPLLDKNCTYLINLVKSEFEGRSLTVSAVQTCFWDLDWLCRRYCPWVLA